MDKTFEQRLEKYTDELKWLYMELYDDMSAYDAFIQMLYISYLERAGELKGLDKQKEEDPLWSRSRDMLGMIIYADCFAGDLKGVEKKLDYFKECGVSLIHLMPLLESPEGKSDGGYAVSDFRKVNPQLGTMADLESLTSACHANGIYTCLDFVMNHTSEEHEWARKAKEGDEYYRKMYFFYDSWDIPDRFEQTMPQVFPTTAPGNFTWCEEAGKVVMTTFYPYQWDLDYSNPVVFKEMTANLLYLCNRGIDVIRLDAVPYIWKTPGTDCRNLPQVHSLVRMINLAVRIVCPGTLLLGEVVMEPDKVVPYFGTVEKPECDMLYNVTTMCTTWNTVATKDVGLLRRQFETVSRLPSEYLFLNYLRCHDDIGWGLDYSYLSQSGQLEVPHKAFLNDYFQGKYPSSRSRGELYNDDPRIGDARLCGTTASFSGIEAAKAEKDSAKLELAVHLDLMLHAFLLTQRGLPIIYGGDEVAQLNDYSYHDDPLRRDDSRYIHRGKMDWRRAALRKRPGTVQNRIFNGLRRLTDIRKEYIVFSNDAECTAFDTGSSHVLGVRRIFENRKLIALFNFAGETADALIEDGSYRDLYTGKRMAGGEITVEACGFMWLYQNMEYAGEKNNESCSDR